MPRSDNVRADYPKIAQRFSTGLFSEESAAKRISLGIAARGGVGMFSAR